jgi:hypothetical protein
MKRSVAARAGSSDTRRVADVLPRSQEVLVLYRKRSGRLMIRVRGMPGAGAFLIQRLEGSRFGMVVLWVLNGGAEGESRGKPEVMVLKDCSPCWRERFARPVSAAAGEAGTRVGSMLESAAKSG